MAAANTITHSQYNTVTLTLALGLALALPLCRRRLYCTVLCPALALSTDQVRSSALSPRHHGHPTVTVLYAVDSHDSHPVTIHFRGPNGPTGQFNWTVTLDPSLFFSLLFTLLPWNKRSMHSISRFLAYFLPNMTWVVGARGLGYRSSLSHPLHESSSSVPIRDILSCHVTLLAPRGQMPISYRLGVSQPCPCPWPWPWQLGQRHRLTIVG